MSHSQAQELIRAELKNKLQRMVQELEAVDAIITGIGLKGSRLDLNLRTAAIAIAVATA